MDRHDEADEPEVTQAAIEAASLNPCGRVYVVEASRPLEGRPPVSAILGAWRVDARGQLTSDYLRNHAHEPRSLRLWFMGVAAPTWPCSPQSLAVAPSAAPAADWLH